jgi:hypothetical protein
MRLCWQLRLSVFLFAIAADCASQGQVASPAKSPDVDLGGAQTIAYCEILSHPETFNNKTIRVRALYETDFERAALTAPSCYAPIPMTWVEFEEGWESRTRWRFRHVLPAKSGAFRWTWSLSVCLRPTATMGTWTCIHSCLRCTRLKRFAPPASFARCQKQSDSP